MKTGQELIDDINACRVPPGQCALWWLGQHGFVVKLVDTVCYIDVFFTDSPDRLVKPLLRPQQATNADLVLGSHDHGDHIDRPAWPTVATASPNAIFIVPELLREKVSAELHLPPGRVRGVDEGLTVRHRDVTVTAIPAAHEFLDEDPATGRHPYVGFIITSNGFSLYHAGDTDRKSVV
jgi:L-ascorbate 6-phosphate lactonase